MVNFCTSMAISITSSNYSCEDVVSFFTGIEKFHNILPLMKIDTVYLN